MLQAFVANPRCAVCGRPASRVELVAPGAKPADWQQWAPQQRDSFDAARQRRTVPQRVRHLPSHGKSLDPDWWPDDR